MTVSILFILPVVLALDFTFPELFTLDGKDMMDSESWIKSMHRVYENAL